MKGKGMSTGRDMQLIEDTMPCVEGVHPEYQELLWAKLYITRNPYAWVAMYEWYRRLTEEYVRIAYGSGDTLIDALRRLHKDVERQEYLQYSDKTDFPGARA